MLLGLSCGATALAAPQHAHVHGRIQLGVALDGNQLMIDIDTPLENLLGFERKPATSAEQKQAATWTARLREGVGLLRINPEARCTLAEVQLDAPVLGLLDRAGGDRQGPASDGHAELEGSWLFHCGRPSALRTMEVGFFEWSPHVQIVEVHWVSGRKQGRHVLKRPQARIPLAH